MERMNCKTEKNIAEATQVKPWTLEKGEMQNEQQDKVRDLSTKIINTVQDEKDIWCVVRAAAHVAGVLINYHHNNPNEKNADIETAINLLRSEATADLEVYFEMEGADFFISQNGVRVAQAISQIPNVTVDLLDNSLFGIDKEATVLCSIFNNIAVAKWRPTAGYEAVWAYMMQWVRIFAIDHETSPNYKILPRSLMTQDNENRDKKLFADRLRTLADLVEQDKIISATFYAHGDGVSPTAELYNQTFPHVLSADFCNCCEDDYEEFLDEVAEEFDRNH